MIQPIACITLDALIIDFLYYPILPLNLGDSGNTSLRIPEILVWCNNSQIETFCVSRVQRKGEEVGQKVRNT